MEVADTLAYYDRATVMAAKSFLVNAPVCPWQAFPGWSNICELGLL
jgi:hypothetical protein